MNLIISVQSKAWSPAVVVPEILEKYWKRDSDYYPVYQQLPHIDWFPRLDGTTPIAFRPGVAYFSANNREGILKLRFNNGRHRTRWLLECQAKEIVIALASENLQEAKSSGLIRKSLEHKGSFELGFEVAEIEGLSGA